MRRVLVVLGLLVALTLLGVTAFFVVDVGEPRPVDAPSETPPHAASKLAPPTSTQRHAVNAVADESKTQQRRTQPARPTPLGRLDFFIRMPSTAGDPVPRSVAVLLPTGEELASNVVKGDERGCSFEHLPTNVPLVVRVGAEGFLTGLCCDVVLSDTAVVRKDVGLVAAPIVAVRVVEMPRRAKMTGVRVELLQGDDVVATGVTDDDGLALTRVAGVGQFRVRLQAENFPTPPEAVVDVWAGDDVVETELEMRAGGTVEVAVVTANGAPARGVDVWLLGAGATPPSARTDREGVATFKNVGGTLELTAVARAADGVARARFSARDGALQRVPLLLKEQAPLVGDVVDEGGGALANAAIEILVQPFAEPVRTRSDAAGHFATPPLPAGLAEVTVRRDGFVEWSAERPVEIEPVRGGYVRARLRRLPTGAVVVSVRDDSARPLDGVEVTLLPSERTAKTAADGTCRIDGLPAGVEQSVVARRRGYRTARSASSPPPVVRVQADVAESADVVLASIADPSPRGDRSAIGVVLDPSSRPVVGARVDVGAVRGYTADDGSFRLEGLPRRNVDDAVEIRVTAERWDLEPFRCFVDVDPSGVAPLGTVRLRSRPYALLSLPQPPASAAPRRAQFISGNLKRYARSKTTWRDSAATSMIWLAYNHDDELLGRRTRRLQAMPCVSYDGTWLHLPPADDWKRDGRGEVFVAAPTGRGLVTGRATWTQTRDAVVRLAPAYEKSVGDFVVFSTNQAIRGQPMKLTQIRCAALFDPRSIHVPTGDEQPPVDPFASIVGCRTVEIRSFQSGATIDSLAPGRWKIQVGDVVSLEATVPEERRISLDQ